MIAPLLDARSALEAITFNASGRLDDGTRSLLHVVRSCLRAAEDALDLRPEPDGEISRTSLTAANRLIERTGRPYTQDLQPAWIGLLHGLAGRRYTGPLPGDSVTSAGYLLSCAATALAAAGRGDQRTYAVHAAVGLPGRDDPDARLAAALLQFLARCTHERRVDAAWQLTVDRALRAHPTLSACADTLADIVALLAGCCSALLDSDAA